MENSINKTRAAHLILSAVSDTLTTDASAFVECCDRHDNLTASVIAAFEDLDYREQTTIGMRLGFDAQTGFDPVPVCRYREIATAFELTCAATASDIFRRDCRKMAASIMEAA